MSQPHLPYADTPIVKFLQNAINSQAGTKSQRQIAAEIGYPNANIISMMKRGEIKVPLEKIPALAAALNVDPALLFRLAMDEYRPDVKNAVGAVFGTVVTKNERELINKIRQWTRNQDPKLITSTTENKLRKAFQRSWEEKQE